MDVVWIGTPNKAKGRDGLHPLAVVIHIMDGTLHGTVRSTRARRVLGRGSTSTTLWYRSSNGEFFWAGATTGPTPT
jgi:hypothetical protein